MEVEYTTLSGELYDPDKEWDKISGADWSNLTDEQWTSMKKLIEGSIKACMFLSSPEGLLTGYLEACLARIAKLEKGT